MSLDMIAKFLAEQGPPQVSFQLVADWTVVKRNDCLHIIVNTLPPEEPAEQVAQKAAVDPDEMEEELSSVTACLKVIDGSKTRQGKESVHKAARPISQKEETNTCRSASQVLMLYYWHHCMHAVCMNVTRRTPHCVGLLLLLLHGVCASWWEYRNKGLLTCVHNRFAHFSLYFLISGGLGCSTNKSFQATSILRAVPNWQFVQIWI